jgi:hypothetical protein
VIHSFANFYYLLLLEVDIQSVREYFESREIGQMRQKFCDRNVLGGRPSGGIFALCRLMGHANESTLFKHYIHTADLAYRYHSATGHDFKQAEIAKGLKISFDAYRKRKSRDHSGWQSGLFSTSQQTQPFEQLKEQPIAVEQDMDDSEEQMAFQALKIAKRLQCQFEVGFENMEHRAKFALNLVGLRTYAQNRSSVLLNLIQSRAFQQVLVDLLRADIEAVEQDVELWSLSCNNAGQLNTKEYSIDFQVISKLRNVALSESPIGFFLADGGKRQDRTIALALSAIVYDQKRAK